MEYYSEAKHVQNVCPCCGDTKTYRVRYKYPDEGKMVCMKCKNEQQERTIQKQSLSKLDAARTELISHLLDVVPNAHAVAEAIEALIDAKYEFEATK